MRFASICPVSRAFVLSNETSISSRSILLHHGGFWQLLVAYLISLPGEIASALILTTCVLERLAKNGGDNSNCWSRTDLKLPPAENAIDGYSK